MKVGIGYEGIQEKKRIGNGIWGSNYNHYAVHFDLSANILSSKNQKKPDSRI
jgi:hypothetical protein